MLLLFFFFFQAEDGIRDVAGTGVQTCALPILLDSELTGGSTDATAFVDTIVYDHTEQAWGLTFKKIGRASCRERV